MQFLTAGTSKKKKDFPPRCEAETGVIAGFIIDHVSFFQMERHYLVQKLS